MQNLATQAKEVLSYFERKTGVIQNMSSAYYKCNLIYVLNRLREGAQVQQCISVIDRKFSQWGKDPEKTKWLQPHVLFSKQNFYRTIN